MRFFDQLILACIKLQGNRIYWGKYSEDDRNTFIANMLEAGGYHVKDQTRWSKSAAGKAAGEIDIFVQDNNAFPFTIIEALNLDSLRADYLVLHIDKLFNYDANGFENNFILVYSNAGNFLNFWNGYYSFIQKHAYTHSFLNAEEITAYNYSDLKIAKLTHHRNGKQVNVFHLVLDLNKT